jgi:glycosyltransferase involved in cell wall biosynthesis
MTQSVLFVSKPISPPFHDGSKCLVRDIARHLTRIDPVVLSTPGAPPLSSAPGARAIRSVPAYGVPGGFTPAFTANLRAASWLLLGSRSSVWHFVFAPNPRTSGAGRWLSRLRNVPVVQTVASPPRTFDRPEQLFFGAVVVAQSEWTRRAIESSCAGAGVEPPRLQVIPPPVPDFSAPSSDEIASARAFAGLLPDARYLIYPGDLETSSGADTSAALCSGLAAAAPDLITVFAYRRKSAQAGVVAERLRARLPPRTSRLVESAPNMLALLAGALAVIFPVDDLWGKVDLPIVLLEAQALGVPVLALDQGPLSDLSGVIKIQSLDTLAWQREVLALLDNPAQRTAIADRQRAGLNARHRAPDIARAYEDLYLELAR